MQFYYSGLLLLTLEKHSLIRRCQDFFFYSFAAYDFTLLSVYRVLIYETAKSIDCSAS